MHFLAHFLPRDMFARAVGRFQTNRKELEESHDLVLFEAPEGFEISEEQKAACEGVQTALRLRAEYQELMPDTHKGQEYLGSEALLALPKLETVQIVRNGSRGY